MEIIITPPQATEIFGEATPFKAEVMRSDEFATANGLRVQFVGTTLGMEATDTDMLKVVGNTVPRLDPNGCKATECNLGKMLLSGEARRSMGCAAANTIPAIGESPGLVLTPTTNKVVFLGDVDSVTPITATNEDGREETMFGKVKAGSVLVVTEHNMAAIEGSENGLVVAGNMADNAYGVDSDMLPGRYTRDGQDLRFALIFSSTRTSLGERPDEPDAAMLAVAYNEILDREGLQGDLREQALRSFKPEIHIGYSAEVSTFGHKVTVPKIEIPEEYVGKNLTELTPAERAAVKPPFKHTLEMLLKNNLIDVETGAIKSRPDPEDPQKTIDNPITPTMVMDYLYPGALENGFIFGAFEAENGIDSPRNVDGCPGDGELCYIHYPRMTERTRRNEMVSLGIPAENITYDISRSIDPASPTNHLASNRLFQLNTSLTSTQTYRTANAVKITFGQRKQPAVIMPGMTFIEA